MIYKFLYTQLKVYGNTQYYNAIYRNCNGLEIEKTFLTSQDAKKFTSANPYVAVSLS